MFWPKLIEFLWRITFNISTVAEKEEKKNMAKSFSMFSGSGSGPSHLGRAAHWVMLSGVKGDYVFLDLKIKYLYPSFIL